MTKDELLALIDQAAAEGWTELDLSGQGLTLELPEEIFKLTQLEKLILGKGKKTIRMVISNGETPSSMVSSSGDRSPLAIS